MAETNFVHPVPLNVPRTVIESYAEQISRKFGITKFAESNDPLVQLTAQLGGEIHYEDPDDCVRTEDGSIIVHGPNRFEVFISNFTGPLRDRFTLAHELGHYFLHSRQGQTRLKAARRGNSPAEWEANWFAAALLMPCDEVNAFCRENKTVDPALVAANFKVSRSAAEYRIRVLRIEL